MPKTDEFSFEKRATLPFLRDCRDFFVEKHPDMWKRMTGVNKVVGKLFVQANTEYARDRRALWESSETLSRCLRQAFEDPKSGTLPYNHERDARAERHSTSPLSALATVAIAAAADEQGSPMPGSNHQSHDSQVWAPSIDHPRSTNTVRPQNKDTSTGLVLGSLPNEVASDPVPMYVQEMYPQWQTYPAQKCSQQTSTHHIPLNGAQSLPPFGFDQGGPTIGAGAVRLQDGSNPVVSGAQNDHSPDPTVQTSVFQETNETNHPVSGQALSSHWPKDAATTNATYDHALHSSLAQFGDGTAEYDNLDWNELFNVVYDDLGESFSRQ